MDDPDEETRTPLEEWTRAASAAMARAAQAVVAVCPVVPAGHPDHRANAFFRGQAYVIASEGRDLESGAALALDQGDVDAAAAMAEPSEFEDDIRRAWPLTRWVMLRGLCQKPGRGDALEPVSAAIAAIMRARVAGLELAIDRSWEAIADVRSEVASLPARHDPAMMERVMACFEAIDAAILERKDMLAAMRSFLSSVADSDDPGDMLHAVTLLILALDMPEKRLAAAVELLEARFRGQFPPAVRTGEVVAGVHALAKEALAFLAPYIAFASRF